VRDKKKNNAFQFIEKGSILRKAEAMRGIETEKADGKETSMEKKPENQEVTLQQIPAGLNRVAVRVKRHVNSNMVFLICRIQFLT
jgi:hypothetical protein